MFPQSWLTSVSVLDVINNKFLYCMSFVVKFSNFLKLNINCKEVKKNILNLKEVSSVAILGSFILHNYVVLHIIWKRCYLLEQSYFHLCTLNSPMWKMIPAECCPPQVTMEMTLAFTPGQGHTR